MQRRLGTDDNTIRHRKGRTLRPSWLDAAVASSSVATSRLRAPDHARARSTTTSANGACSSRNRIALNRSGRHHESTRWRQHCPAARETPVGNRRPPAGGRAHSGPVHSQHQDQPTLLGFHRHVRRGRQLTMISQRRSPSSNGGRTGLRSRAAFAGTPVALRLLSRASTLRLVLE